MKNYVLYMSGARNQKFYIKPEVSGIYLKNLDLNVDRILSNISTTGTVNASNLIYNTGNNNISGTLTANNLVYNTGNQTISGVKTFDNNINISGTGTFNGLNLENINSLTLSGMNINITGNSVLNIFNEVKISGNPVLTGIPDNSWASQTEIDSLSGLFTGFTGNLDATYATDTQLISTGSRVDTLSGNLITTGSRVDTLSGQVVFTTGDQVIGGNKTFTGTTTFSGTNTNFINSPVFISGTNLRLNNNLLASGSGFFDTIGINTLTPIENRRFHQVGGKFLVESDFGAYGQFQLVNPDLSEVSFVFAAEAYPTAGGGITSSDDNYLWAFGAGTFGVTPDIFTIGNLGYGGVIFSATAANGNIGIGTSTPSEKLEVNGNVKFGSVEGSSPTLYMYDGANGYYNRIFWGEKELTFADDPTGANQVFGILYDDNVNGELTLYSNLGLNGTRLIFPSGKQGYIAIDSELVHKTGNETISGIKTFIGNHIISGNTTISGSINISGNYDIYSQIENAKKLAIAYAIAL